LAMLLSLPNKLIYEVIQSISEEWEVSKEESEGLYHYLIEHKNRLPNAIDNFINKYNNNISNENEKEKKKEKKRKRKK
jgi:hypothetical protein